MLDVAVAYNRYRFLGQEFLTWVWYAVETAPDLLRRIDPELSSLEIGNRLVVENHRRQTTETVSIRGDEAGMEEGILALGKGALVAEMNLVYRSGEQTWHFSVKGESLHITGLKVPETGPLETLDDVEAAVIDKAHLCRRIVALVHSLFHHFIHLRLGRQWNEETLPAMRAWVGAR